MSGRTHPRPLPVPEANERSFVPSLESLHILQRVDSADPDVVHAARTSARRLRSNVRVLDPFVDPVASRAKELGWVGDRLGAVRDIDVLASRIEAGLTHAPDELQLGGRAVLAIMAEERATADGRLRDAVASS